MFFFFYFRQGHLHTSLSYKKAKAKSHQQILLFYNNARTDSVVLIIHIIIVIIIGINDMHGHESHVRDQVHVYYMQLYIHGLNEVAEGDLCPLHCPK